MSSPTNQTAVWNYNGDGSTVSFPIYQPIQSVNDVKVTTTTGGVTSAPYTVGVDYNISGIGTNTILVTFLYLVPQVGTTVTIKLNMVLIPNTSISVLTTNTGTTIQGAIDKLSLQDISQAQQIADIATATAGGGVLSVNGNTGAVTITAAGLNAAPINSPSLTGVPTAPTATTGTNTTQLATTAFVANGMSGTTTDVAVFNGSHSIAGDANLTFTESSGTNALDIAGTTYAILAAVCTGGANVQLWANATQGFYGTLTNHPMSFSTNNTQRASFAKEGILTINYGYKTNNGGLITNSAGTLTIAAANIVNNGLIVQTGSTASTWTLPTGTAMDTAVGSAATVGDQIQFTISNTSSATITMAAGSGFTLGASYTVATLQSRVFTAYRTGTNTWVLY